MSRYDYRRKRKRTKVGGIEIPPCPKEARRGYRQAHWGKVGRRRRKKRKFRKRRERK